MQYGFQQNNQVYFYIKAARGADAKGMMVADGFAVLKGSIISPSTVPSMPQSLIKLRTTLIEKGIINEKYQFTKDHIFTSPSLAAAIVTGGKVNGRTEWKTQDKKSINDIEEEI